MGSHRPKSVPDFQAWAEMISQVIEINGTLDAAIERAWPDDAPSRLAKAVEHERMRLARDLHSGAGQALAGIQIHLGTLDLYKDGLPEAAQNSVRKLHSLAERASSEIRAVSHRMYRPVLPASNLVTALKDMVESSGLASRLSLILNMAPLAVEPDEDTRTALFRCAQDCVSNIIRHSGATTAEFRLESDIRNLVLTVSDDGHGFDPSTVRNGVGLPAIRENAESVGGCATISRGPNGTSVRVSIPLERGGA